MYTNFGKRAFDLFLAALAIIPAALISAICVVAIKFESHGPAIFKQTRVGRDQKPFILYKLRTMSTDTGDRASHEVSPSQITRSGHILRKMKLDELPQLANVLRGDMSFVGPRPSLPSQEILIAERDRRGVYAVRPGITGRAQLSGIDMSTPVELAEEDARYIAHITLLGDLKCIFRTAVGHGKGDAVKRT